MTLFQRKSINHCLLSLLTPGCAEDYVIALLTFRENPAAALPASWICTSPVMGELHGTTGDCSHHTGTCVDKQ